MPVNRHLQSVTVSCLILCLKRTAKNRTKPKKKWERKPHGQTYPEVLLEGSEYTIEIDRQIHDIKLLA